jgi:hypothetical protein
MCIILSYKYIPKPSSPHMHAITHALQMQLATYFQLFIQFAKSQQHIINFLHP